MKKINKRVVKVVCFLLVFLICFFTVQGILSSNSNNTRRVNGLYAEEDNSLDVLYVGTSRVGTYVSPVQIYKNTGLTGFNMCFDGTSLGLYKLLIKEALQTQNPQAIVLNITGFDTPSQLQTRSIIDNMRWSQNKLDAINEYSDDGLFSFIFPITYYHIRWKDISPALGYTYMMLTENIKYHAYDEYSLGELLFEKKYPLKGQYTSSKVDKTEIADDWAPTEEVLVPEKEYMDMLDELLKYLSGLDCKVLFVNTPATPANSSDFQKKLNYIGKYLEDEGFDYIDYNYILDEIDFDLTTDMGDKYHGNVYGSVALSNAIGEYLDKNIEKPIEKSDEVIADWNKAVNVWDNCLKLYKAEE